MESILKYINRETTKFKYLNLIISGGNSPLFFFKKITKDKKKLRKISFYLTDERLVDKKSKYSNYNNFKKISQSCIIKSPQDYRNKKKKLRLFSELKRNPIISIIGIGKDGHYASIFNKSKKLSLLLDHCKKPDILITEAIGKPKVKRATINLSTILLSKKIFIIINSKQKKNYFVKCVANKINPLYTLVKHSKKKLCVLNAKTLKNYNFKLNDKKI